jgi:hypothetical protein
MKFENGQKQLVDFEPGWPQEYRRIASGYVSNISGVYQIADTWCELASVASASIELAMYRIFTKLHFFNH